MLNVNDIFGNFDLYLKMVNVISKMLNSAKVISWA